MLHYFKTETSKLIYIWALLKPHKTKYFLCFGSALLSVTDLFSGECFFFHLLQMFFSCMETSDGPGKNIFTVLKINVVQTQDAFESIKGSAAQRYQFTCLIWNAARWKITFLFPLILWTWSSHQKKKAACLHLNSCSGIYKFVFLLKMNFQSDLCSKKSITEILLYYLFS